MYFIHATGLNKKIPERPKNAIHASIAPRLPVHTVITRQMNSTIPQNHLCWGTETTKTSEAVDARKAVIAEVANMPVVGQLGQPFGYRCIHPSDKGR